MDILNYQDFNDYFSNEINEKKLMNFEVLCYKNMTGRSIVFHDLKVPYYSDGFKEFLIERFGYLLIENEELDSIVKSNKILMNLIETNKLQLCSLEDYELYKEGLKGRSYDD